MRTAVLLLALGEASVLAAAGAPQGPLGGGWKSMPTSLLLFDQEGSLSNEIGLGIWEEPLGNGLLALRDMRGGATPNGRFAWHWQKVNTLRTDARDIVLGSTRTLVYLGTDGQVLWKNDHADAPPGADPLIQSDDGETALVVEHSTAGWSVNAYTFTGNRVLRQPAGDRIERFRLTANGRFALVLWGRADDPLLYSLLDLRTRTTKDIPAEETPFGRADIDDTGTFRSEKKTIYRFPDQ